MLEWQRRGVRYRLSLLFPALVTVLLLCQPKGPALACILGSVVHECGHLLMMWVVGLPPEDCTLGAFGMRLSLGARLPGYGRNLLVSAAGPMANGVAACILYLLDKPTAVAVHLLLMGLNLLPVSGLDGGEMLRCILCLSGHPDGVGAVLRVTSAVTLVPLAVIGVWLFWQGQGNVTLPLVSGYLLLLVFFSDKIEKNS